MALPRTQAMAKPVMADLVTASLEGSGLLSAGAGAETLAGAEEVGARVVEAVAADVVPAPAVLDEAGGATLSAGEEAGGAGTSLVPTAGGALEATPEVPGTGTAGVADVTGATLVGGATGMTGVLMHHAGVVSWVTVTVTVSV